MSRRTATSSPSPSPRPATTSPPTAPGAAARSARPSSPPSTSRPPACDELHACPHCVAGHPCPKDTTYHCAVARADTRTDAVVEKCWRPDALSAVEHRPADVVPQPLVVEYEIADRLRKLVALPPALESPCALAPSFRRAGTCGLDRIGGRTELVRGDVCDDRRLAGSVRGMARRPTQVSGRGHCMTARRASLGHRDLATCPGASLPNRLTRSRVLRPSPLEPVQDVLRARCSPQCEDLVIRIGEGPTAADRHETRVAVFGRITPSRQSARICPTPYTMPRPFILAPRTTQTGILDARRSLLSVVCLLTVPTAAAAAVTATHTCRYRPSSARRGPVISRNR
jgi:hypothetical protein